jgi:hypothetical protein
MVERYLTTTGLYAVVVSGACAWCSRSDPHAHEITEIDAELEPTELDEIGVRVG